MIVDVFGVIERPQAITQERVQWCANQLRAFTAGLTDRPRVQPEAAVSWALSTALSAGRHQVLLHPLFWRLALERSLGEPCRYQDVSELFAGVSAMLAQEVPVYADVRSSIDRLRTKFLVGVLSNGNAGRIYGLLEAAGVRERIDAVLVSGEWTFRKPDGEMFLAIAAMLGVKPAECLMVGDRIDNDILGAQRANMMTCLLSRPDSETTLGTSAVTSLSELADVCLAWARDLPELDRE